MTDEWMRRKFAGVDTAPLFDDGPARSAARPRPRPPKTAGRADCPDCKSKVGLYVLAVRRSSPVLAYRRHYKMIGRTPTICRRSNAERTEL